MYYKSMKTLEGFYRNLDTIYLLFEIIKISRNLDKIRYVRCITMMTTKEKKKKKSKGTLSSKRSKAGNKGNEEKT